MFLLKNLSLSLSREGNLPPLTMFSQTTDAKVSAASPGIILNAARERGEKISARKEAAAFYPRWKSFLWPTVFL